MFTEQAILAQAAVLQSCLLRSGPQLVGIASWVGWQIAGLGVGWLCLRWRIQWCLIAWTRLWRLTSAKVRFSNLYKGSTTEGLQVRSAYQQKFWLEPFVRLYASVLNARIVLYTEDQAVRVEEQAGFRPGRSTMHAVFTLQHFTDLQLARQEPMYICFLNLRAAYDRVSRPLLWRVLQRLGIGGKILAAVQSLYSNSTVAVQVEGRPGVR